MKTSNSTTKNSIGSKALTTNTHWITGPRFESPIVANATNYWYCESCGYESTHRRDLYRKSVHASDCEVRS